MKIAINDANILFDLIDLDLIYYLFRLDYSFYTTDMVIDEFKNEHQKAIIQSIIKYNNFTVIIIDDITKIFVEKQNYPKLSVQDCSVLVTAIEQSALILTGDSNLRKTALIKRIEVHGILWVFDKLIEKGLISSSTAFNKLTDLMSYNSRLPYEDCSARLEKWKNTNIFS